MTPVEFLSARYNERETQARIAIRANDDGRWRVDTWELCRIEGARITIYDEGGHTEEQAAFIAANDPAYVLADIAAKRRLMDEHSRIAVYSDSRRFDSVWVCKTCGGSDAYFEHSGLPAMRMAAHPCRTLRLLAQPFADHPDYNPAWQL